MNAILTTNIYEMVINMGNYTKINFLGDSITAGATLSSVEQMYTFLVCRHFNAVENNYGKSGTRIARQAHEGDLYGEDFNVRAQAMDKTADFTFVFGGTNDYGHGAAPIGNIDDNTEYTFYGALNVLCRYLLSAFGRERLCFILPLHRRNEDDGRGENFMKKVPSLPLSGYVEIIKEVLESYGINYLDLSNVINLENVELLTNDGLHPNECGHRIIANEIIQYLAIE